MRPTVRSHPADRTEWHLLLAVSSLAAGVIHAAVVSEHFEEEWAFGAFFVLAAAFQVAWAIAVVVRPASIGYTIGALANGAIIGIWIVSRTTGLPIGPEAWTPEPVLAADVAATVLESLLVIGSVMLVRRGGARPTDLPTTEAVEAEEELAMTTFSPAAGCEDLRVVSASLTDTWI